MARRLSSQEAAKIAQGYVVDPMVRYCSNCKHYQSKMEEQKAFGTKWVEEKEKRCSLGGFAVKKRAVCNQHEFKEDCNE